MKSIAFLVAKNPYDSTRHFAKGLGSALQRQGVEVEYLEMSAETFYRVWPQIKSLQPDMTCSFSDITVGQKGAIGDFLRLPHLSLLIDPVIYYLHQTRSPFSLISTVDEGDVAFLKNIGFERAFFFPHAIERALLKKERQGSLYDVAMLGSCIDYEEIASRWEHPWMQEVAQRVLTEDISILEALIDAGVQEELPHYHYEIDMYVRGFERVEMVRTLKGLDVHIWGQGKWKKYVPWAIKHPQLALPKSWS